MSEARDQAEQPNIIAGDDVLRAIGKGFLRIPEYLSGDTKLSVTDRYVYGVLLKYVEVGEKTGRGAFPGQARIAEECNCNRDTITTSLKRLSQQGWVSWRRRGLGQTNMYEVFGPAPSGTHGSALERNQDAGNPGNRKPQNPATGSRTSRHNQNEGEHDEGEHSVPNGTGALVVLEDTPATRQPNGPWLMFEAFCRGAGLDPALADARTKGIALKAAKKLLDEGYTEDAVELCAGYLASQSWRRDGTLTMTTLAKEIGPWRMKGSPSHATRTRPGALPTSDVYATMAQDLLSQERGDA